MAATTETPAPLALRAHLVFPVVDAPIAGGVVTIHGGRIVAVGEAAADADVRDLGNVAILPGLVNAHTHLEFSHLQSPVGPEAAQKPGTPVVPRRPGYFTAWLRSVTASRRLEPADSAGSVEAGLRECLRLGTTTVGEIAQPGWSPELFERAGLDATVFLELIGPTPERAEAAIRAARSHLDAAACSSRIHAAPAGSDRIHAVPGDATPRTPHESGYNEREPCWRAGLSPHAPYSVRPELLEAAVRLSAERHVPLAFHLAESRDELELMDRGSGPLRDFLEELGAWRADAYRPATRPLDYLRTLAAADRALVIHGNYLDDEEIGFLARHRDRMAAVYCPRTHAWFGHDPYPLERMLAAGVTVALGTDSRASSPDLSLLAEIRHVARRFPRLSGNTVLRLGTLDAARAMGRDRDVGSLEPGKSADLAVVALGDASTSDPYELVLASDGPVVSTWRGGRVAWP